MFTGIITGTGTVVAADRTGDATRLELDAGETVADLGVGGSLALDGVCLTALPGSGSGRFAADVMGETLDRTTLGRLAAGDRVNLERCVPAAGRLDGHVVQGHIDATGRIVSRTEHPDRTVLRIALPGSGAGYVAEKGSIAVDGISLTLSAVSAVSAPTADAPWFEVSLIPETLARTGLGRKTEDDPVNLEYDVLAKYVDRLLAVRATGRTGTHAAAPTEETR